MSQIIEKTPESSQEIDWLTICNINDIVKNTGVCADFKGEQVAIFHIQTLINNIEVTAQSTEDNRQASKVLNREVKAVANLDPFAKANVLSRGLITEKNNQYYVASPLLKQEFCLNTGQCQQDDTVSIKTYKARIVDDFVQLMEV